MSERPSWLTGLLSRKMLFLPPVLVGVAVVGFLAASKNELKRNSEPAPLPTVQYITAKTEPVFARTTGYGQVRPSRQWKAVARVGGDIREIRENLKSGSTVQRGELLAVINPTDYQLRLDQSRAELTRVQAQLAQLQLSQTADKQSLAIQQQLHDVRQAEVNRMRSLGAASATSKSEVDAAVANLLQQSQAVQSLENSISLYPAQIEAAAASVSLFQAKASEAEENLSRTRVVAPFAGVLSGVTLEQGQYVTMGQTMFEVHDIQSVEVEAQFSLSQLLSFWPNRAAEQISASQQRTYSEPTLPSNLTAIVVTHSGDIRLSYSGRPVRIAPAVDEQARTLGVVVSVENELTPFDHNPIALRAGAYCEVELITTTAKEYITVPRESFRGKSVLVLDETDCVRSKRVEVAFALDDRIAIASGLSEGDRLVVTLPDLTMEGTRVRAIEKTRGSDAIVSQAEPAGENQP